MHELFCRSSTSSSSSRSGWFSFKNALVSSDVEKLFIRMNRTSDPNSPRVNLICSAIRSRKVLPFFTGSKLFAFSSPMDVPRPPFSLSTAVLANRSFTSAPADAAIVSSAGSDVTPSMVDSGTMPSFPATS